MKHNTAPNRQRGVSLVEVALAAVILGACAVVLWGVIDRQARTTRADQSLSLVDRAHDAILAYAYLHRRLPCAAESTDGIAACGGTGTGFLPYITLGLPDPKAGNIRYRVSMTAPSPVTGAPYRVIVGQRSGSFNDLFAQTVPLATVSPGGHEELFDLCEALNSGSANGEMAYELTLDPGTGAATAASPSAVAQTIGRSQLAARLQCASMAAAGRAHFNAALAADTMARAMADYDAQFNLGFHTYYADWAQGLWFFANSTYSTKRAITKVTAADAEWNATNYLHASPYYMAVSKIPLAGLYTGAMASNLARFSKNIDTGNKRRATIRAMLDTTNLSATEIKNRAILGSSSAFFLEDKWSAPAP